MQMQKFHLYSGTVPMCTMTARDEADATASFKRHYPDLAWGTAAVQVVPAAVEIMPRLGDLLSLRKFC